jgi:hypothetical protein
MTSASVEPRPWARRRWGGMVALVFIVQLGLIFWLGSRTPIHPRLPTSALTLYLGGQAAPELQALADPTLFALPHPEGFSGPVWRRMPRPEFRPFKWSAPTDHFPLAIDRLGAVFNRLLETNQFQALQLPARIEAAPTLPEVPPLAVLAGQSIVQLEDGLAQRRLLAPLQLKSFTNTDILANSIVRVGVDTGGLPVSVTLLSVSGSPAADQFALDQAWAARFEPLNRNSAETIPKPAVPLGWGRMVFRWHTVPMPLASAPAASP